MFKTMTKQTNTKTASAETQEYELFYVVITTEEDLCDLYPEDRDAAGSYKVHVPRGLEPSVAAVAALGAVHSVVPIKYMSCFESSVFDEEGHEITPDYDLDWYDTAEEHSAYVVK